MASTAAMRLGQLPPYLFVEIDRRKAEAIADGRDVIDFGVGDPDHPTPGFVVESLNAAAADRANHRYPPGSGKASFRRACARYMKRRFDVDLDAETEILALIGSKEGIGHLPLAVVNPGKRVIVPSPGYPVYASGAVFAGGRVYEAASTADRGWRLDVETIPDDVARDAVLLYLNYPNNPTGATATLAYFEEVVAFARRHDVIVAHDAAYCDVFFEDPPPSILQVPGAAEVAVEFHSLSKTFNMTGWRVGFAAGRADVLSALGRVKNNLDSGVFGAVQDAAAQALDHTDHVEVRAMLDVYRRRRDAAVSGLSSAGFEVATPEATFYVWARCPEGYGSMEFATTLLERANVVVVPGVGFGRAGEGCFRLALTVDEARTREAMARLGDVRW